MESPPKRITRARAAVKSTKEPAVKNARIVTAAVRAKSTATASTKSATAKRKTRADESDDEDEFANNTTANRRTRRGQPHQMTDSEQQAKYATSTTRTMRGRPVKKLATETSKAGMAAPVKTTRARARNINERQSEEAISKPTKATVRGRTATTTAAVSKTNPSAPSKSTARKAVKFQEPDKENMAPKDSKKQAVTTSIRGRPARRGGASAARCTRQTEQSSETATKKPLSPKKVTQMPVQRDEDSEDELAGAQPLKKSPVKPPSHAVNQLKDHEARLTNRDDDNTLSVNNAILNPPDLGATAFASPARRAPSILKETLKSPPRKMGAVPLPGSALKHTVNASATHGQATTSQNSLLFSAAKRPSSPIKGLNLGSPSRFQNPSAFKPSLLHSPAKRAMPGLKTLEESTVTHQTPRVGATPAMKPLMMSSPLEDVEKTPSEKLLVDDDDDDDAEGQAGAEEIFQEPIAKIKFPGRLSAVLPREVDPAALDDDEIDMVEVQSLQSLDAESMEVDENLATLLDKSSSLQELASKDHEVDASPSHITAEPDQAQSDEIVVDMPSSAASSPTKSPLQSADSKYQLRAKDLDPCRDLDMDSDTELMSPSKESCGTPTAVLFKTGNRRSTIGLTSLAEQLGSWPAGSPEKGMCPELKGMDAAFTDSSVSSAVQQTPGPNHHFFEDEMESREDVEKKVDSEVPVRATENETLAFDFLPSEAEDLALAQEADEMAKNGPDHQEFSFHQSRSFDDSLSDASQEYGDENQMPIDPAILEASTRTPATPLHSQKSLFPHTTTKVPLKPADDSTPSPLKKRSASVSRLPSQRASHLTRSTTAPSLPPSKSQGVRSSPRRSAVLPPVTPEKSIGSSAVYTPGTRDDVNPRLLRGAVVFVDVHTTEGADASGIFMELLMLMGARCRKTWDWSPNSLANGDSSDNKVGITHVVYKDGGKRTLEKVRQTHGLVHCVGVSWVLDCERENEWLDEGPYSIDTAHVPRGGARRRKSMEPKALTNLNGTLINSSSKNDSQTPVTLRDRRESTVWTHTPSDQGNDDKNDIEWSQFILTPVPKTPAPEAIAKYAAEIPETPSVGDDTITSPTEESLMMRTCPPKPKFVREMDEMTVDSPDRDEQLMRRLMAARRKSLQFAPKIASPLSRAWK